MHVPLLLGLAAMALMLPGAGPARAFGPGDTVGLPMGSPDTFGLSTVNRPADAEPLAGRNVEPAQRRLAPRSQRRLKGQRHSAPKRHAPTARR
ncbi:MULTISPECIES: hypothetical protein [unclassified Methylobacterium]|uniref:hypothetical protein n=1 Tax=unclassified Methylobacterium TaxID=2615210 RepID=UPI003700594D